jgi:hypothetical protein
MLKTIYLFFMLVPAALTANAQTDSLTQPSPVKTLSIKQYDALQKGDDLYGI